MILDNCEHVIDGCAELAGTLLSSMDRLRIVATSREPMGIDGETVWPLEPLDSAELPDAIRGREAFPRFAADAGMEVLGAPLAEVPVRQFS